MSGKSHPMSDGTRLLKIVSKDADETFRIGKRIGEHLEKGDVIALIGELGTGKTCIARGIARGVGVPDEYTITSPTFTLINEYRGRLVFYHFDLYRLNGIRDMEGMGYEEYFFGEGVSVVEWAEKIEDLLPEETLFIYLTYIDENEREIIITQRGQRAVALSNLVK